MFGKRHLPQLPVLIRVFVGKFQGGPALGHSYLFDCDERYCTYLLLRTLDPHQVVT